MNFAYLSYFDEFLLCLLNRRDVFLSQWYMFISVVKIKLELKAEGIWNGNNTFGYHQNL